MTQDDAERASSDTSGCDSAARLHDENRAHVEEMGMALEASLNRQQESDQDQHRFMLFYQPKADLRSGRVIGAEALIRWSHPELGLVAPSRFIDLAETNGMMPLLGDWVVNTVCTQAQMWHSAGVAPLAVSVNVSRSQFMDDGFVTTVENALHSSCLSPASLEFEVTSDIVVAHPERSLATMRELVALGVSLSVDAFQAADASIEALRALPVSRLKIHRELIRNLHEEDARADTAAVIATGRELGLQVVAVGVEAEQHLRFLREHGCDEMQGYVLSRPVPAERFPDLFTVSVPRQDFRSSDGDSA